VIGIVLAVLMPLLYGVMGFIMGAIGALLYNLFAGLVGGFELRIETLGRLQSPAQTGALSASPLG
jgi:hypothetical protein